MKRALVIVLTGIISLGSFAQDKPAYRIFNQDGVRARYKPMIRNLESADFVFIGELHNNSIAHWMELEITKDLFATHDSTRFVLGAEMFESDNQLILDEYLSGMISESRFEAECRLWPNYKTDYKPLVLFAKNHHLPFIATNVPRRYASLVSSKGFEGLDSLSLAARGFIPPLPIPYDPEVACYKEMLTMGGMGGHGNDKLPKAQAIKDATMAHFINLNWYKGVLFIHYNGSYHSDNHEGIIWYLTKLQPSARIVTVKVVTQDQVTKLEDEYKGKADFIIVVPSTMTNTY